MNPKITALDLRSEEGLQERALEEMWPFPLFPWRVAEFIETGRVPSNTEAVIRGSQDLIGSPGVSTVSVNGDGMAVIRP